MADIFEQALKNAKKKRKNVINLTNLDVKTTKTTKKSGGKNKNGSASKQPKTDYKYSGNKSNGSNVKEKSKSTSENAYKTKTRYGGGKNKNNKIKSQYKDERPTNNLSAIAEKKKKEAKEKEKREAQRAHNKQVQSDRVRRKNAQTSHQKSTNGKKSGLVQGHGSNADKQLAAEKNASKRNDGIKSRQLPAKTREIMTNSKYRNFVAGVGDAVIDNSPVGIAYSVAKGKKLSDSDFMYSDKATKGTKDELVSAQDAGEMAGTAASYLTAYGAAGKATGKAAAKVVGSSAAQKTIGKLAGTKLGKTVGKEFIENTAKSATKDAIADATIGTAMDYGQARGQGLEGSELYKYMGKQALINLGLGAVGEAVPFISTAVRNTRLARQAAELAASNASDAAKAEKKLKLSKQSAKLEEAKKTAKQRQKDARKAKTKANLENTKNTQHNSLELNKYDEAMSTSEKKSSTRKGEGVKLLKNDSGFNSYMAEKYGDIYSIENVAKKNGQTLSKFLTEEYEAYKFMPDDMKLNYEASENVVADVEAKTGVISDSEKREFSIYLQHKYGDFSNAEAAAKKQGMDMQAFFQKEKALYDQAKTAEKNATADTFEDVATGETVPNVAKQADDIIVDPATGETIPNMAKTADGAMVDPATGETIPNTAKAAQEGAEEAVGGVEKSAADAFEEGGLTPESKKKVYDAVQKRTGVKIVEEEFAGDIANSDGYYKDGVIHINANSKQPKYTVLKHELTHHMQSSKNYDAFSEFIFDNLKRKGFDIDDLRAKKIASYAKSGVDLSMKDADFELVAEYCGEFLFNSQKSIDRLARENYTLATWVLDWIKDTIAKIGKSDDAKFLIDAQRKYEYALRNADVKVDGKQWNLYAKANKYEEQIGDYAENSGKTAKEIKRDHNLHRGFKGDWLTEVDDSKARLNITELEKAKKGEKVNLRNLLEHKELWRKAGEDFDGYRVTFGRLKNDEAGAEIDYAKKLITISNQSKGKTDSQILSSLLHETQHALQDYYGLPHGANINLWDKILSKNDKAYKDAAKEARKGLDQFQGGVDDLESLNTGIEVGIDFGDIRDLNYEEAWNYLNSFERKAKRRHIFEGEVEEAWNRAEEGLRNADFYSSGNEHLAKLAYHNTAGELEAYDVQSRMELSKEGRKKNLPRQRNENTRYVEDYGYYPDKSSLYVKATPEEAREQIISGHDESYANFDKHLRFSTGENVIKDPGLKKTSQNLYSEKGNKYLQTASEAEATAKSANTELPKSGTKAENKLPTKNGKKQAVANGKAKSVSADAKNPEAEMTYEQASKRYETYKNGTPKKLPAKGDVSKAADTIIGSDVIGDEMREAIKENVSNYVKVTKTNRTTIDNVAAKIDSDGLENSISNFRDTLAKKNRFNEEDIAMGAEILRRLDDLGDYERALDITDDLVEMMSQAGRTLQAANIFTSMTPYGKLRSIKRAAAKMSERYGKNVEVNEDLMKELFEAKDSAKADKIKQRIFEDLWNQVPSSLMEKLDALRYTAMLSSPKTHIRNILGNAAMYVGKSLSDGVEAALEKTVFKGKMEKLDANRTKSFLNPFSKSDRELKKKAGEIFESVKEQLMNGSSKYIEKGDVRPQNSRVFKSKTLEAGRKIVSGTLEWEDEKFMKANFQAAFAKICKANGLEVGELTARELRQYTAYAAEQAQAATFRDPNALASAMNKVYRWANDTSKSDAVGKLGKGLVKITMDATVPFRRTPANILKQAWRYSPGGVAEGMTRIVAAKDAESLLKGIEILSNGVVGTPIVLAGAYLGYQGIVTGSVGDYSDKKTTYDKMLGDQDYAVNTKKLGELFNVNIGDTTITMDWLSPYSMPFFVGTELGTALSNQEGLEGLTATQLVDAMASITEPFLEMSMMQGVQDLITQSYDGNAVEVMATNQMKTYVTQFVPTLLSQIAKTVAEEKTTTKTVNDGTVAGKSFASTIAQLKSKVPGLYETNQPDVDVWGRTETKEDVWDYVRAGVRNILSPANVKDINITDVDKEILSVYDSIDDEKSSVIPTPATSSVEYKGTTYKMTDSQWTDFKKDIGSARYSGLEELFKTKKYKNSSPDIKAKLIKEVYSDALASAKRNFLISSGNMTEEEYNKSNITSKAATKLISSGKTTATKVTKAKETLKSSGVSDKAILQAYVLYDKYDNNTIRAVGGYNSQGNYKISDNTLAEVKAVKKAGVSLTQLQKAYVKSDKDGNGSIKKDEATAYLNKTNYSQAQKRAIFDALMSNPETNNPY